MANRLFGITLLAGGMLAGTVFLIQAQEPTSASADSQFIIKAAQGGIAEVKLGNVAKDHAQSTDVKDFGQKMVDDHSKANDELKALAAQKNVTLPNEVDPKSKAIMTKLAALNGDAFDRAYVKDMVADHKQDIAEFRKEANNGKDPDVKAWASKTLPTLEAHLGMIQNVQHKLTMNPR